MRILAIAATRCIKMNNEKIVMCLFYCLCHSAAPWEGHFGDTFNGGHVHLALSTVYTDCMLYMMHCHLLICFFNSYIVILFVYMHEHFAEKGQIIEDALVLMSCPSWLSCWFCNAIWSSESCIAIIATICLLLKYSQSGWRSNKSSKSNAMTRFTQPYILSIPALFWMLRGQIHHFVLSIRPRADMRDKNGVFIPRAFKPGWCTCNFTKSGPNE
jgi:hypothetical protein